MSRSAVVSSPAPARINPTHPIFYRHPVLAAESDSVRLWLGEAWPPRMFAPKATIAGRDQAVQGFVATGWVGRVINVGSNRTQIIDLLLPGDALGFGGLGACERSQLVALTGVQVLSSPRTPPEDRTRAALDAAMADARRTEGERHVVHLLRLGAYTPEERLCCLFSEIHARLTKVGLAGGGRLPMPLSQSVLANMISVSSVHLNRTLRTLRLADMLHINGGQANLDEAAIQSRYPHLADARHIA